MDACRTLDGSAPPSSPAAGEARPNPARRASIFSECLSLKKYNFVVIKCQGLRPPESDKRGHRSAGGVSAITSHWHRMTASLYVGHVNAFRKRRATPRPNDPETPARRVMHALRRLLQERVQRARRRTWRACLRYRASVSRQGLHTSETPPLACPLQSSQSVRTLPNIPHDL